MRSEQDFCRLTSGRWPGLRQRRPRCPDPAQRVLRRDARLLQGLQRCVPETLGSRAQGKRNRADVLRRLEQARSVIDGLPADVITMNMATDINALADNGELVPKDWVTRLPNHSAPFTSATVFIVRKGNPKGLKDWNDLVKPGVEVIVPNPKTSGNGRYTYLSAWGYTLKNGGDEAAAKKFVGELFAHVPVLDTGGRGATTTFMTNQIGDVLVTFENEAEMIAREFGRDQFEVVYPSVSAEAEPPVSVVDKVVDKKGTRAVAEEYLKYLWSPEGQEIAANNYLRPRDPAVLAKYTDRFPKVDFLSVEKTFGDWRTVQKTHFNDGGIFDQIYAQ